MISHGRSREINVSEDRGGFVAGSLRIPRNCMLLHMTGFTAGSSDTSKSNGGKARAPWGSDGIDRARRLGEMEGECVEEGWRTWTRGWYNCWGVRGPGLERVDEVETGEGWPSRTKRTLLLGSLVMIEIVGRVGVVCVDWVEKLRRDRAISSRTLIMRR